MDKLSMCRICLVEDVKMYSLISANLQELYKRLTKTPFETKDKRPIQVCYLCCARLQNCHRLQTKCLKSEEFFNKVIADRKLKKLQDLNTLKTVHPLILISCVPSTRKDPEDDKIDEDNDFKEIASNVQVKRELFEDASFPNEEVHTKSEVTVGEEDISTEDTVMTDNRHTMQNTELEHVIHLKTRKIVLERTDMEQFEIGTFVAEEPKSGPPNGNTKPETEVSVVQNNNFEENIQTIEKNKNTVEEISFTGIQKKNIELSSDIDNSGIKLYRGVVCEKNVFNKSGLPRHRRTHPGERPYKCNVCEQSFSTKSSLLQHSRVHTGEKPYKCKICEKSFSQNSILIIHTRRHTGDKPYRCNVCEKGFVAKNVLLEHSRIHTGEKPYSCKICEKSFCHSSSLVYHTRRHTAEKPYRCKICDKSFSRSDSFAKHTRIHTGENPYRCEICEKSFSRRRYLINHHTRIHTGKQPYRCKICEKSFSRRYYFMNHTLNHSVERLYTCDICQKNFRQKRYLIRHIYRHMKSH